MNQIKYPAMPDTWDAIDGLGRKMPVHDHVGDPREKFVGLFYWTWHDVPRGDPHNMADVADACPEALQDYDHPAWQSEKGPWYWNEPIYGYYRPFHKWVLRKHAELLANAGVDVVIFDNTNGVNTWDGAYQALAQVFSQAKKDGVNAPGIAFLMPLHWPYDPMNAYNCRVQLRHIYVDFYRPGKCKDTWFYWKGKPLVMAYPDALDPHDPLDREILEFFTFRPCQPKYSHVEPRENMWGWLSLYPQQVYNNPDGTPEQITVGVAQNYNEKWGLTGMNADSVFGRTYTSKGFDTRPDAKLWGANFQEQWDYALQVDPEFVFVTGWNEWMASRNVIWNHQPNALQDECDDMNSRDCEPSKGDLKDHYYYQLCANIRRFKGARPQMEAAPPASLGLEDVAAWEDGGTAYGDYPNNIDHRYEVGWNILYENNTGRNDILYSKVSHDRENVYIAVKCASLITPPSDKGWMRLFLRTRLLRPDWEGFHFVVNRINPGEKAYLEQSLGGWKWKLIEKIDYRLEGDTLIVKIPRAPLGLDTPNFKLWFKWADNNILDGDIMDVYTDGDTAPGGRFMFFYHGKDE